MLRLLLIDDSFEDFARFKEMLAVDGIRLEHCTTLADGLARTWQPAIDAVLLNLQLPDSTGIATYLRARERWPVMPIVVLALSAEPNTVALAYQHGVQDFLFKSKVTSDWLVQSVRHAMLRVQSLDPGRDSDRAPAPADRALWSHERIGEVLVLRLHLKRLLDANAIMAIEQRLMGLVDGGHIQLVVSMRDVEYISNAALGVLIGAEKRLRAKNGMLHLADLRQNVRNQLGSRQFHRLFRIHDDVASAVASITPAN